ncbi:MAG: hypothetical protein AB1424_01890 [Thermodesulfobacteriota bacterium]
MEKEATARNLEVVRPMSLAMPEMDVEMAVQRFQQIGKFVKSIMQENVDFGVIPGTKNKTLLKPGAEKLCTFFGLTKEIEILDKELDWTGQDHGGEPFFYLHYKIRLSRNGRLIAEADGSANSWESKHRYRQAEYKCPKCEKETIRRSKEERGGGWYCWGKIGGCGAQFPKGDAAIESQDVGKRKNPDPADLVNTIQKMAYKRALIAATLVAVNASEYFTQDMDDLLSGKNDKEDSKSNASSAKSSSQGSQKSTPKQGKESPGTSQDFPGDEQRLIPMTIPDILKACQTNMLIPSFPVPIITTKKVAIGEWVNRYWEGDILQVVLEILPDREKTTGVTKERITNKFKEAGYEVVFQEPGTMQKGLAQEEAVTPPPEQSKEHTSSQNRDGKTKSFF